MMKHTLTLLIALLLESLAATHAAAADKPAAGINPKVKVAAYYFPNWGPVAHSEWGAIKAAKPKFEAHAQPKVPVWGYENENDPTVMARKISAAADHGINAFIFDWYYYHPRSAQYERAREKQILISLKNYGVMTANAWN